MHRSLLTVLALPALAIGSLIGGGIAHADTFTYSGRLLSAEAGAGVGGAQVIATAPLGAPAVVATTAADGTWSFTSTGDEFSLQFGGNPDYQTGFYDSCISDTFLQPAAGCTNGPGVVPDMLVFASYASGRILDSVTSAGVGGAVVEAREADGVTPISAATTNAAGEYRLDGIATDEIALFVNGAPAAHSSGYFGCLAIVTTYPEACTFAPGPQGDRLLAPLSTLSAPRLPFGFSLRRGTITLFFVAPATGTPTGYELTCTGRNGVPVVRSYSASLQTRSGFQNGRNTCTLRALGATGPGPSTAPFTVSVW
ncbi:MAG: hypothetical protein ABMA25_07290 [Ilumatobacteraceae bacterium]